MFFLFLLRHGETDWNKELRFQGKKDIPLNKEGILQAQLLADRLRPYKIEHIYTSPLKRAYLTAQIIAEKLNLEQPPTIKFGLKEIDHGLWEGKTENQIRKRYKKLLNLWYSAPYLMSMPQGECLNSLKRRVILSLDSIFDEVTRKNYKKIGIVSHEATNKIILLYLLGLPLSCFWVLSVSNASITLLRVNYKNKVRKADLLFLNDTCHLNSPLLQ